MLRPTQSKSPNSEIRSLQPTVTIEDGFVRHVVNTTAVRTSATPIAVQPLQCSTSRLRVTPFLRVGQNLTPPFL